MSAEVSDLVYAELAVAADTLRQAASVYRAAYEQAFPSKPVLWLRDDETGGHVFLTDAFNAELIPVYI